MKLAHPDWNHTLEWDSLHPGSLVLEHPLLYRAVTEDLVRQERGEEGVVVLSEGSHLCTLHHEGILVRDLWSVDVNAKKLLHGVYRCLNQLLQEEHYDQLLEMQSQMTALLEKVSEETMLPLEWELPEDAMPMLKAYGVSLEEEEDLLGRLVDMVRLSKEYLKSRFLILIGVRSFWTEAETEAFCRDLAAMAVPVLFLDPVEQKRMEGERRLVIDADQCELSFP